MLASNTHNQALLDLITGGVKQLSTPFITDAGTYIEEYWNTGTRTWTAAGKPVKAIVTVTGTNNADVTVTEDDELTSLAEPNGWTYESVLPVAVFVPGPVDGDTNEQPNGSNNGSQAGGGEQAAGSENANSVSFVTGSTFSPLQTPVSI